MAGSAIDIPDYLARIGYDGPVAPTLPVLRELVTAQLTHIPFENLDPLMGIAVDDLSPDGLSAKLVRGRRGGFCFENTGLMAHVLEELGFQVARLTGRVVWMNPEGIAAEPPELTHQLLAVRPPDSPDRYLVDVGFGGQSPTAALDFTVGTVQETPNEPYRVGRCGEQYYLETLIGDKWQPMYVFTDESRPPSDLRMGAWYASTHPSQIFVNVLVASLVIDGARWNLGGANLTVHTPGEPSRTEKLGSAAEVLELLTGKFGIAVDGLGDVEARLAQVIGG